MTTKHLPSDEEVELQRLTTIAMRAFEPMSSVLRYREADKWHACDVMGMREAVKAVTTALSTRADARREALEEAKRAMNGAVAQMALAKNTIAYAQSKLRGKGDKQKVGNGAFLDHAIARVNRTRDALDAPSQPAAEPDLEKVREYLGDTSEWETAHEELRKWCSSAFLAGETDASDHEVKYALYSFLCGLSGYIQVGKDAAAAIALLNTEGGR